MPRPRSTTKTTAPARKTRSVRKPRTASRAQAIHSESPDLHSVQDPRGPIRQLAIIGLALVCGLLGLVVHVFWLAAIVLMSVLFGLIAANVRGGRGVIPELVAEVQGIADDLSKN
jgi:hypothetical protein